MIKNMNSKMTSNSQLLTTEPKNKNKNKLSKPLEWEQNHRNGDHMDVYQWGGGANGGKFTGNKQHKWQVQNRQDKVKNNIKNVEAKVLIGTTHGHELRGQECGWEGGMAEGNTVGKNGTTVIA